MKRIARVVALVVLVFQVPVDEAQAGVSVQTLPAAQLQVTFAEPASDTTATNLSNYTLSSTNGGGTLVGATLDGTLSNVVLQVPGLTEGAFYSLRVSGIRDRSPEALLIVSNTTVSFWATSYAPATVGTPAMTGMVASAVGGYTLAGTGADVGGKDDQFLFNMQRRTGDFDVRVRLASLSLADAWSKAGLMAREDLSTGSAFAAVWATPSIVGSYFEFRAAAGMVTARTGSAAVNYPATWLRLRRAGSLFSSYSSFDGVNWMPLGSANLVLPGDIYFGLALCSHQTNAPATAVFRDLTEATGTGLGNLPAVIEPLGPSSRRTGLVISEIMFHPAPRADARELEFIEILNTQSIAEDLSGCRISGAVDYRFPTNTLLPAGAFVVVARNPADLAAVYGVTNVLGPWTNALPNDGGTVRLRNELDAVLLEVSYETKPPWPVAADGAGHSLVLARPSFGEGDSRAWDISDTIGGSPGVWNPVTSDSLDGVFINEFLAHTDPPLEDYIELYNHSNEPKDLSGAWLSDSATTNQYRIADGVMVPARGFVYFTEGLLGFALDAGGERIFLMNSNRTRVIDALDFGPQENSISFGRVPDGGADWYRLAARTPGTNNGLALASSVVINEIMFNPISGLDDDQYVEVYNRSSVPVDLGGWRFTRGVDFTFPANTILAAHGYLVVAGNAARLRTNHANLTPSNCLGDWKGRLSHGGERLALAMPHYDVVTNGTQLVTNPMYVVVNEVTYGNGGRWGDWADGGGSSLELINPDANNRLPSNWADSDESAKSAPWVTVEYTGALGETLNSPSNNNLHIYLLGVGECLVDDVEVATNATLNLVTNAGFENGLSGWTPQGAYDQSTVESGGFSGTQCLHVRGSARGDTGANKIRSPAFQAAGTVTLRCKAKWLRGWPELLLRLHGGGAEAFGRLPVPANLGTPGAQNSRWIANLGPAIFNVQHAPALPAGGRSVLVTAQVDDPNGLSSVMLRYRVDPGTGFNNLPMRDDGTAGDAVANDGVYSATLPGYSSGYALPFHVRAVDGLGVAATFPRTVLPSGVPARLFPSDATSRECVVRFGDTQLSGGFGTYHIWLTAANRDRWTNRDNLNNAEVDCTFVYNNSRVVYNAGALYSGSPFHRGQMTTGPDGANRCDYIVRMPGDDPVLGETDFNLALPGNGSGGNSSDLSGQGEQTSFIVFRKLGIPFMYRRYIHVFVNGSQRSAVTGLSGNFVLEDTQQPNGAFVAEWFADDPDGELIKIEDWFEFDDTATSFRNNDGDFTRRLVPGTTNLNFAPYRFMWRRRAVAAGESANDYTDWLALLNAISPTTVNTAPINYPLVNDLANLDNWFREMACQRTVGNYDSYGWDRGKNNYLYRPTPGRFQLIPWDVDWVLGTSGSRATNASIFGSNDPRAVAMQQNPVILRSYLRAFRDVLDGPLKPGFLEAAIDEKAVAFTANGVAFSPSITTTLKTYVAGRRDYLENQLAVSQTNFSVLTPNQSLFASNLVTITGTAPFQVFDIKFNGHSCLLSWLTSNVWSTTLALAPGTNLLNLAGFDRSGAALANATASLVIRVGGTNASPVGTVVLNEILYQPAVTNAEFVELLNAHPSVAFDLSGWRINGLDYTFPAGTVLGPGGLLVLAKDRLGFAQAYGTGVPVFDEFGGRLDQKGETLTLFMPGAQTNQEVVVDRVRYEAAAPWPTTLPGASLQLRDAAQDTVRVANWGVGSTNSRPAQTLPLLAYTNSWKYMQVSNLDGVNWTATNYNDAGWPGGRGLLAYEGNATIRPLTNTWLNAPTLATNNVVSGHGYYFRTQLIVTNELTGFTLNADARLDDGGVFYVNGQEAKRVRHADGVVVTNTSITTGQVPGGDAISPDLFTLDPALFRVGTNVIAVEVHQNQLNSSDITFGLALTANFAGVTNAVALATPGAANSVASTLPAFPTLWLNEAQADNVSGPLDNAGQREPWVEVFNPGTNTLSLGGYYLSDNYTNLSKWTFPSNVTVGARSFLVVWCDNQTGQGTALAPHAGFRLASGAGQIALSRALSNTVQLVDYLTYTNLPSNWSYGDLPDAQPCYRDAMFAFTPGATNSSASPPLNVFINEWMADNTRTLADPADGDFEDWFEIYNPGTNTVDLGGYWLTDNLTNKLQYLVPNNGHYQIPPGGYLLVWADNEDGQNNTNRADLHASFALSKGGEAIGIFAADGTAIDAVTFGAQTSDVSEGRFPNGLATVFRMPTPTPRAGNVIPNTAPVLGVIADKFVHVGQALRFTATATDTEGAFQQLTFGLDPGAPPGAGIHPQTGAFTWSNTGAGGPGTNLITVRVTDDGTPPMSDAKTFSAIVRPPPQLESVAPDGEGGVELVFSTLPGTSYQLEFKDTLDDLLWTPLGSPVTGTGGLLLLSDDMTGHTQRFYRLVALP